MRNTFKILFIGLLFFYSNSIFSQETNSISTEQGVFLFTELDPELVPKDQLKTWVEEYDLNILTIIAESGHEVAQRRLARYYVNVERDFDKALKWYKESAANGDYVSQGNLAVNYRNGDGVEKNLDEAIRWYKAAVRQEPYGEYFASWGLRDLLGFDEAMRYKANYYLRKAEKGTPFIQYKLGRFYKDGTGGLTKNLKKAKKWLQKSADQGFEPAKEELEEISKIKTISQLSDLEKVVNTNSKGEFEEVIKAFGFEFEKRRDGIFTREEITYTSTNGLSDSFGYIVSNDDKILISYIKLSSENPQFYTDLLNQIKSGTNDYTLSDSYGDSLIFKNSKFSITMKDFIPEGGSNKIISIVLQKI